MTRSASGVTKEPRDGGPVAVLKAEKHPDNHQAEKRKRLMEVGYRCVSRFQIPGKGESTVADKTRRQ